MLRSLIEFGLCLLCLVVFGVAVSAQTNLTAKAGTTPAVNAPVESDRSRDGLVGPVRRVRTEIAKLMTADGKLGEGKHTLVEIVAYDIKGNKVENQYFPIPGATLTGKEVYKYDEKGNISEMTLLNPDGTLMSKEIYKYEFDFAGNWNKMTTSVAVVDARGVTFEPSEITYRNIMYYLDENMVKMVTPATSTNAVATTPQPVAAPPANNVSKPADPKANPAANKARDTRKGATTVSDLPAANSAATKLAGGAPMDVKTPSVSQSQSVVVDMDEPPPTPAPRPILKPVSGGVLNGTAINLPPPVYPDAAKRMRVSGTVTVDVILDETGKVVSANATNGPAILRDAAIQAALKARFSPTKLSGQPVKVSGVINYKFALVP
ncbi:MAG TPA: TonB family protein [Pyrinomonadaceae bacterium]|jgi:TonB family protein|nr:TonB family protein [Pyrinomonadaceae bacterium]